MGCTTAPISFPDSLNEVSSSPDRRCIASFINGQNEFRCKLMAAMRDILSCGVEDLLTVVRTLRGVLDATIKDALGFGGEETS